MRYTRLAMLALAGIYRDANDGAGSGGSPTDTPSGPKGGDSGGETKPGFTQADLDAIAGKVRAEEKAKYEAQKLKDEQDAKTKADEENGQFKSLYEVAQAKLKAYEETELPAYQTLASSVNAMIDGQIAEWPEELKGMDPGPASVTTRQEWFAKAEKLAAKFKQSPPADPDHGGAPGKHSAIATIQSLDKPGTYAIPGGGPK